MALAIIGATGNVGSQIVEETLRRKHDVTAIARDPAKLEPREGLTRIKGDALDPEKLSRLLTNHYAVVSAVPFRMSDPELLIEAVRQSGVKRYLVVGGAGSLVTENGKLHIDSPHFPEFAREEAQKGKVFLDVLRTVEDLDWTMLCPSALFTSGERTGKFRLGDDNLIIGADGKSWISYQDFAVALLDEIEKPKHIKRRFTVGY